MATLQSNAPQFYRWAEAKSEINTVMKINKFIATVLVAILVTSSASAGDSVILEPGNVIESDLGELAKKLNGEKFFALHREANRFKLSQVKLSYTSNGEDGTIASALENVLVFIRHRNLRAGYVPTGASMGSEDSAGQAINLSVLEQPTTITLGSHTYVVSNSAGQLVIQSSDGGSSSIDFSYENIISIYWAGDIDRDNLLDLIVFATDEDGKGASVCLLLSSEAKSPALIERVACEGMSG